MTPKTHPISLEFNDLGLVLHNGSTVLDSVTGAFEAGQMVAIMGPSGAGKTTFMNVLCGKATYGTRTGTVLINGEAKDIRDFKRVMGFVPQDDIVHDNLTVREQIFYAARLRNSSDTPRDVIRAIVEDVLRVMQIDHIQATKVGGTEERGISGGQRKRVNIGLELAARPTLLFLDEPTSGLDSTSSLLIVNSLNKMTELGMTIIMVIHQPRYSLFTLYDKVLLLGKGGRTVYLGAAARATTYFENLGFTVSPEDNLADWLMDVISGEVENTKVTTFSNGMLFDWWEQHISVVKLAQVREQRGEAKPKQDLTVCITDPRSDLHEMSLASHACGTSEVAIPPRLIDVDARTVKQDVDATRGWSSIDDKRVIVNIVETEWAKIDLDGNEVMEAKELHALLTGLRIEASMDLVAIVMERMSGPSATVVTRGQFITFLQSQCELMADASTDGTKSFSGLLDATTIGSQFMMMYDRVADSADVVDKRVQSVIDRFKTGELLKNDLERELPGFFRQYITITHRRLVQFWRNPKQRVVDTSLLVCAALCCGFGFKSHDLQGHFTTQMILSVLSAVFVLKVFADKPIFWRESASCINVAAFYFARLSVNTAEGVAQIAIFTFVYYFSSNSQAPFHYILMPFLLIAYYNSGFGYMMSIWLPPGSATLPTAASILVVAGLLGNPWTFRTLKRPWNDVFGFVSPTRWSTQMTFLATSDIAGQGGDQEREGFDKNVFSDNDAFADEQLQLYLQPKLFKDVKDQCAVHKDWVFAKSNGRGKLQSNVLANAPVVNTAPIIGSIGKYQLAADATIAYRGSPFVEAMGEWGCSIFMLLVFGTVFRLNALILLLTINKDKRV
eukprot:TRINITY_DN22096_c2_g1_i1.p1 TRINITY_DN22096_c2_g1~~TRINITY_DN22096_c2_g1_i1.p1  ORF type:complete len:991 (+),score=171.65 TRINITY_DN22096_c2_g1_i1:444-2975(+)